MCSRCLAFGAECNYSPSSRAGKPKSEHKGSRPSKKHRSTSDDSAIFSASKYSTPPLHVDTEDPASYFPETEWSTTPTSDADGYEPQGFMSPPLIPVFGDQGSSESSSSASSADAYDSYSYWTHTSPTYVNSPYIHNVDYLQPDDITESPISPPTPWVDHSNSYQFSNSDPCHPRMASNPNLFMDECLARTTTCNCFNACLEALQTLHNFNAVPPASSFDIVLTVNQKAMEICSTTLNCSICNSRSGSNHHTMLLGTILGRIILIYQDASRDYFGPASEPGHHPLPLTFGVYRVASEDIRWMQLVIILRDLKKFKGLLTKFQKAAKGSEAEEDIEMHRAVTNRLYQSLNLTCHALKKHKDFSWGHAD
ncbi:hypothetical protein N431DRAFT_431558 [Stipitochalara longipes BDJ]|nr:hypothetical protein N431DRAFT_431558 [Stipitochalara longipes BDJ]